MRGYVLDYETKKIRPANNMEETSKMMSSPDRILWTDGNNLYKVSTVFLVIDHSWEPEGEPVLFETMVFPVDRDLIEEWCARASSYSDAYDNHVIACSEFLGEDSPYPKD